MKKGFLTLLALLGISGVGAYLYNAGTTSASSSGGTTPTDNPTDQPTGTPTASSTQPGATPKPTSTPSVTASPSKGSYKDGTYTGSAAFTDYGTVQVRATVSGGKLTGITFLQLPNDRDHSIEISNYASPQLRQEALSAQSANVDIISGATSTSEGFIESLTNALSNAQ